jgi:hypothetical protein
VSGFFDELTIWINLSGTCEPEAFELTSSLDALLGENTVTPIRDTANHLHTAGTMRSSAMVLIMEMLFKSVAYLIPSLAMWVSYFYHLSDETGRLYESTLTNNGLVR